MLRFFLLSLCITANVVPALAQFDRTIQQIPGLNELPDVTAKLQAFIESNSGNLRLDGGKHFRITAPLVIDLTKFGAIKVSSTTGATLIMDGPGPALRIIGSHNGTASPTSFQPATWNERMPIVTGIEILGSHPEADGIELQKTVEATISKVAVRWCRHGIHLVERNRNVTVADCHLYENSGVGVFLDNVDLHQINVGSCHISYNRQGGIVVRDGNVRNLQVSGCDIEANMPADDTPTTTANVLIDVSTSAEDRSKSIAEISITGCTIQHSANYSGDEDKTTAPGGANIRLAGKEIYPIDSVTITGNVLSDTTTNIDINYALDVAISANNFFAPKPANLTVANSRRVMVSGNTFNPRQFVRPGTIHFTACHDCVLSGNTMHAFDTKDGAIIVEKCSGMLLNALSLSDCGSGIVLKDSSDVTVSNCRITRLPPGTQEISADDSNQRVQFHGNSFAAP
ncbi:MAG: right-handed parallel beta-helix repeat-containing protein [Planctomycetaceae bacterium]